MGLFDTIKDQVTRHTGLGEGSQDQLTGNVGLGIASSLFERLGGVSGIVQKFHSQGLGSIVDSWVGTGPNQPVAPEQVQQALGSDNIAHLAQHFGTSHEDMITKVTQYLPLLVDHLTPKGQIPTENPSKESLMAAAMSAMRNRQ